MTTGMYHLRFLLRGVEEFIWFEATQEDQRRLDMILEKPPKKRKSFFCMDTLDGYSVSIAIEAIQVVNYLWDFRPDLEELAQQFWRKAIEEAFRTDFHVYFDGRPQPMEFNASESSLLGLMAEELDMMFRKENLFVRFQDEDGEAVAFQAKEIVALIIPHATMRSLSLYDEEE